ncbi:unnamed protein product [Echinostoma caproni]|uniref:Uncharacterized protein n=1 Tax=Echinostoma caproni TaxID=27848 RepID=A0A183BBG4_9TREM|nr:unnamed protein product [Echinostoma caproni]
MPLPTMQGNSALCGEFRRAVWAAEAESADQVLQVDRRVAVVCAFVDRPSGLRGERSRAVGALMKTGPWFSRAGIFVCWGRRVGRGLYRRTSKTAVQVDLDGSRRRTGLLLCLGPFIGSYPRLLGHVNKGGGNKQLKIDT